MKQRANQLSASLATVNQFYDGMPHDRLVKYARTIAKKLEVEDGTTASRHRAASAGGDYRQAVVSNSRERHWSARFVCRRGTRPMFPKRL